MFESCVIPVVTKISPVPPQQMAQEKMLEDTLLRMSQQSTNKVMAVVKDPAALYQIKYLLKRVYCRRVGDKHEQPGENCMA